MMKKILLLIFLCVFAFSNFAQDSKKAEVTKPTPDIENGKYGEFERNVFDLWKPRSKKPTPLVVYIHGGGFNSGSKEKISANQLNLLLKNGIAVMAINYRLLPEAIYPQHYMDCARAIQFARFNAKDWNIDKTKVAAMGSSAGGLTSLWIGFHDDLADAKDPDPVLRESTRLKAMAVFSAQTTLVPDVLKEKIGDVILKHSFMKGVFFGIKPEEVRTSLGEKLIREASPMTHLTKDDPPVWAFYSVPNKPLTADSTISEAIHHPAFGEILKKEMDKLKIECKLRHKDDGENINGDWMEFLLKNFK
jgi:hypothetical protein